MNQDIELLFFHGCPHHAALLPHLRSLLAGQGVDSPVRLVAVLDDRHAQELRFLGSPSLRVDGHDIEPGADERGGFGMQCRVYGTPDGLPADTSILTALRR